MEKRIIGRMSFLLLLGLVMLTMTVSAVTIIPICTDPKDQAYPAISGDTIVWQDYRNGNYDIYKWDPVYGESRVTTDLDYQAYPAISGDTIVWQDFRNGNLDIYKWDPVNGEKRVTTNTMDQISPAISGDTIVWRDNCNFNYDIYKWDPVQGIQPVCTNTASQERPKISGDTVVWQDNRNGNWDIYKWDPVNGDKQVTTNTATQEFPAISGDTIVWIDWRMGSPDIYKWDPVHGEQLVTTNPATKPAAERPPAISGDTIVWSDIRNGWWPGEIYKWDPVNGEQDVCTNTAMQDFPAISGDTIVWQEKQDIYAATTPSITVTSPNGWESWARGTPHTVTWDYTGIPGSYVKIMLLKGGTQTPVGTIKDSWSIGTGGKGSYTWNINPSGSTGSDYKVKVQSISQPTISDTSNNYFTLAPLPTHSITVTSPHGGETWQRGTLQTITWSYTGSPGSVVKITLVMGDIIIGDYITDAVTIGSNGKGSYLWHIPLSGITSSGFKVSVQSISQPTIKGISDKSFTLTPAPTTPSMTVTVPNGGEIWQRGTTHTVTWDYTGDPGPTVKIELLKAGQPVGTATYSTSIGLNGKGSYPWTISSGRAPGNDYQILIQSVSQPSIKDTSDGYFTITSGISIPPPSITVTAPNGDEILKRGTPHTVTWDYMGNPGLTVKIVLLKAGTEVGTIAASTPIGSGGKGSYTWAINPVGTTGSDYKVKVQSISQPTITDTSNNYFTITPSGTTTPSITVSTPNGGESWKRGTTQTVKWSFTGNPGSYVKIELLQGGTAVGTATYSTSLGTSGTGSYPWAISSGRAPGTNYRIRVTSVSQPTIKDASNNNFTITL